MFTGIIQNIGTVCSIDSRSDVQGDMRLVVDTDLDLSDTQLGASIACSGCCLSMVEKGSGWFAVDVSRETLAKTAVSKWGKGTRLNIEPSLRLGDEVGGHFVSGHVDGLARLEDVKPEGGSHRLVFSVAEDLSAFIAQKGSVTLDGVSLTVNEVENNRFGVNVISHTWKYTTFGEKQPGSLLNVEVDLLARYMARFMGVERSAV